MTKVKILALVVGMVLLFTLPATVSAQRLPPHVFVGTVTMDGAMAADGTTVTAMVGGMEAGSTMTSGGNYSILVDQGDQSFGGEEVTFQIDGHAAMESAMWMQGGGDELNLTADSGAMVEEPTEAPEAPMEMMPGPQGERGPAGPAGADGAKGDTGSAGSDGAAGAQGDTGSAGAAGAKGDTGAAGSSGAAGPIGATGPAGADGSGGSNVLGIVALILAIVAIVGAGGAFLLGRRS